MALRFVLDDVRVMLERRVGRQHVVVRVDDRNVGRAMGDDFQFVVGGHGGDGVRHVGTTHALGTGGTTGSLVKLCQISASRRLAFFLNQGRNCINTGVKFHRIW